MRKSLSLITALLLLCSLCLTALALPTVEVERQSRFSSFVSIPSLAGLDNQFVQDSINRGILSDGGLNDYLATLNSLTDEQGSGIQVLSSALILRDQGDAGLLAVGIDASGRIGPGRPGQRMTALNYDLASGQRLTTTDIFIDAEIAQEGIDQLVEEQLIPEMSTYLDAHNLLPVPLDNFLLDQAGITFYYDTEQLALLSGHGAAVDFHYDELSQWLKLEEGDPLERIGVPALLSPGEATGEQVAMMAEQGSLYGLPVTLSYPLDAVLTSYPLLMDSEGFPGGTVYLLEDARMRGNALIVSDADPQRLSGILSQRMNLFGLITGKAERAETLALLGEPAVSLDLGEAAAASYGLEPGLMDSYVHGEYSLDLIYRTDDALQAVWLRRTETN